VFILYNNMWSDHRTLRSIGGILMNRRETKSPAYNILVRRLVAYLADILLLFAAILVTQFGLEALTGGLPMRLLTTGPRLEGWVWLSVSLPTYLYFVLSESSVRQATPGKRLLGLRVADMAGRRIGFGQALVRTLVKLIPWEVTHLSLFLPTPIFLDQQGGFLPGLIAANVLIVAYLAVVVITAGQRGIHDLAAGTMVLPRAAFLARREAIGAAESCR
jgi:uncharacterized RDD family membrane protein YckC